MYWTPISGAKNVAKSDTKRRQKGRQKGRQIAALFYCVFLDTKRERVAHRLSVFYIEIFDFDKL
jgi:hypothetical protein